VARKALITCITGQDGAPYGGGPAFCLFGPRSIIAKPMACTSATASCLTTKALGAAELLLRARSRGGAGKMPLYGQHRQPARPGACAQVHSLGGRGFERGETSRAAKKSWFASAGFCGRKVRENAGIRGFMCAITRCSKCLMVLPIRRCFSP